MMNHYVLKMADGTEEWVKAYSARQAYKLFVGYIRQFKGTCRYGRNDVVAMSKWDQ